MNLRSIALIALSFMAVPAMAEVGTSLRDQQWIFRERHGDGTAAPTAVFLSWNYTTVLMKAECRVDEFGNPGRAGNGGISFHYYPDSPILKQDEEGRYIDQQFDPFVFARGNTSISVPSKVKAYAVTANVDVTPQLLSILKTDKFDLEIIATNEMDEPWYVGQAEPLYRLAQACAAK